MIFFTSDLHLNHANIINYCNRPFKNLTEMNDTLINNWNSKISNNDIVYVVGDFIFKNFKYFINKLNGQTIYLIPGDHDKSTQSYNKLKVVERVIFLNPEENIVIVLCHWSFRVWAKSHYNSWNLFGHSHGRLPVIEKNLDIGVDNNNFYPWSYNEIKEYMRTRPDNLNLVRKRV